MGTEFNGVYVWRSRAEASPPDDSREYNSHQYKGWGFTACVAVMYVGFPLWDPGDPIQVIRLGSKLF